MKTYLALWFSTLMLLSGCTPIAIAYYYRQMDHSSRWQCSHASGADRCAVTLGDAELSVSSLDELGQATAGGTSQPAAVAGRYGLEVRIVAGEAPVTAALLKTHLQLPDGSVLAPVAVTQVSGVMDAGKAGVGADPQQLAARVQAAYELRFALDALPEAYILSLAPLDVSGKQHSPPLLAMRIEYGPD